VWGDVEISRHFVGRMASCAAGWQPAAGRVTNPPQVTKLPTKMAWRRGGIAYGGEGTQLKLMDSLAEVDRPRHGGALPLRVRGLREASIVTTCSVPSRGPDVPLQLRSHKRRTGPLDIAYPTAQNLNLIDELTLLLNKKLAVKVATLSQIAELLKEDGAVGSGVAGRGDRGFALDRGAGGWRSGRDAFHRQADLDRQRYRAGDQAGGYHHFQRSWAAGERYPHRIARTRKWPSSTRIDGVLHYAMPPIAKDWQSTIISRIRLMSELDIAEKRVRRTGVSGAVQERLIDLRVSLCHHPREEPC